MCIKKVIRIRKISQEYIRPIRDIVYQEIRKAIITGLYKPGDKLQEEDLAEKLGVSRTPVREALRKLEVEHFVIYYPHRGTVVSEIPADEVDELYQVRLLLETFIARKAAVKATAEDVKRLREILAEEEKCIAPDDILDAVERYNDAIFQISGAVTLVDLNKKIREILQRIVASNHLNPERRNQAHQEHLRIVEALERNDPDLAEQYTVEHLKHSPKTLCSIANQSKNR